MIFARWDDPLSWSVSLSRWKGYRLGVHWLVPFWVIAELLLAWPRDQTGPVFVSIAVVATLAIALTRELVRLAVCRRYDGEDEDVTLGPVGVLSGPTMPRGFRKRLAIGWTALGVNIGIGLGLAVALSVAGVGKDALLFNPFRPAVVSGGLVGGWSVQILWWSYFANACILLINLLPMLPFDGGRLLDAFASTGGRSRSRVACFVGILTAGLLCVVGMVAEQHRVLAVGALGMLASWLELRRIEFAEQRDQPADFAGGPLFASTLRDVQHESDPHDLDDPLMHDEIHEPSPEPAEPPLSEADELDRVLKRISEVGAANLTDEEKRVLERETRKRRGG